MDLWTYEREQWNSGLTALCGVDEAGAGPLAGPVYAAAVILPREIGFPGLNDSKKLTAKKRNVLFDQITATAEAYSIAFVTAEEIDSLDILNARMLAMNRAIEGLSIRPDLCLIDGNRDHGSSVSITAPHMCLVGGDGRPEKRLHRRGLHPGQGQPGPVCDRRAGPGVSPVPVCQTQGLWDEAPL